MKKFDYRIEIPLDSNGSFIAKDFATVSDSNGTIEDILSMSEQGQKLFDSLSESEKKTFVDKIKELIHNLMDWVSDMLGTYKSDTYEAKALQKYQDKLQEIAKIWDEMILKSVEANQALEKSGAFEKEASAKGEVQFSFRDSVTSESKFIIEEIQQNIHKISSENKLSVKTEEVNENIKKSDYVFDVFKKQGGMAVNPVIGNVELNRSGAKSTVFHGFGGIKLAATKAVKDVIEQGDIIREIKNYRNTGTDRFIIAAKGKIDKEESYVGIIVKAYPNNKNSNAKFYLHEAIIIKADSPFMTAPQLSVDAMSESASTDSISDSSKNVNTKFSDRDTAGRTLSEGQQEFFKDSAVRDNDGNLLVMYHGTNSEFTVFEQGHKRTRGFLNLGEGFYFTPSKSMAENYDEGTNHFRIIDAYLNVKKPFEIYGPSFEKEDFERVASELGNHTKVTRDNITESLKKLGYDGVISRTYNGADNPISSVAVFDSSQAKLTSNLNPTENKDVRYSDRDYSYEFFVNKPAMRLTEVGGDVPNNRADIVYQAIENAKSVGYTNENGKAVVYVEDVESDVVVPKKSIVHGLDRRLSTQAPVMVKIGEILKNSIRVNELVPRSEEAQNTYVLIGAAVNKNNELYIASFVVNRLSNEVAEIDVLYSVNAKKENRLRSMRPEFLHSVTDSTISIAELLDYVNDYFPDILPESVLRHYNYDARPNGELGESALFSDRETVSVYEILGEKDRILKENEQFKAEIENLQKKIAIKDSKVYNKNVMYSSRDDKWHTDLTKSQLEMVENWIHQVVNHDEKRVTDTASWYRGKIDGEDLFVIYSTEDVNNPTILYEVKGKNAKAELDILLEHLEDIEYGRSIVGKTKNINTVLSGDWMPTKHNLADNNAGSGGRRSNTGDASILQGKSSRFIGSKAFRNVIKNLFEIQSRKTGGLELYSDRETVSVYEILGEKDRILKENEQFKAEIENLKERIALEKKVTNGTVLKNSQLLAAAAHLRNIANSNMDKVELARTLKDVSVR